MYKNNKIFEIIQKLIVHAFITIGWFYICRYQLDNNGFMDVIFAICCSGNLFWLPKYRNWILNINTNKK
jgi:hypothetical protein